MRLRFGDVVFDSAERQVRRAGGDVHLSPKAFDLLRLLIERRPDAVSKAEIRERLWPETFVSDANLPTLVREIREVIGDNAREPQFVRTLHGFGYAFTADIRTEDGSAGPAAWLVGEGRRIPLVSGENVLGREGAEFAPLLAASTVSRRHARIVIDGAAATAEDLESKNGTYVNDARVTAPVKLADGDRVRIGSLLFTFRTVGGLSTTETQTSTG